VQLHRYWPETSRIEPLPALVAPLSQVTMPAVDVFPDGREVVYVGRPAIGATEDRDHLWILDLETKTNRRIGPDATLSFVSFSFPLAASADGRSVLFSTPVGNTHPIVSVARDGSPGVRTVLPLIQRPVAIDASPDGTLFIDQLDQPAAIFRFDQTSRALERLPMPATLTLEGAAALPLPDGRLLVGTRTLGRDRLVVMTPGRDPVPFIDTEDDTSAPMALLGTNTVLLFTGVRPKRQLGGASLSDGRIVTRFTKVDGNQNITALAGSPDGKAIFYVAGGGLWTVNSADDTPRRIRSGDGVAVTPDGRALIVMLNEAGGIRLVRHELAGGKEENIPLAGLRLSPWPLAPNAAAPDGRLAVRVTLPDSWFWPAAIFDPRTGRTDLLPEAAAADMLMPGWDAQGRLVTIATFTRSTLWQFRPAVK
jgi:dipeptidyl aminopeptidase/acylaminoacyl peptidase